MWGRAGRMATLERPAGLGLPGGSVQSAGAVVPAEPSQPVGPVLLALAARVGTTRLIDNALIDLR